MALTESLAALLHRDLSGLRREVEAYPDEASIWAAVPGLTNSGGILVRHLCGNLQHYVGAVLGDTGYVRDRPAEFGAAPWTRERLLAEIAAAEEAVAATLSGLDPARLEATYPEALDGHQFETGDLLVHLAVHLGFHLGQVGYHRRTVTGEARSVGAGRLTDLATARPLAGFS